MNHLTQSTHSLSALVAALLLAGLIAGSGCVSLPKNVDRTESHAFDDTAGTALGTRFAPVAAQHPGKSGLHPMPSGVDAFAARLTLANQAQRSLDLQYYIWQTDTTGTLLAAGLLAAADRGVRVRILLDDHGNAASDQQLLAMDSHPNIEVRLINPYALRRGGALAMLPEFARTNRRMHNKSFTADNQVAIIGGRNIGDEYFQANSEMNMADLDVLGIGPVVADVSRSFDAYWNSAAAFPITTLTHERTTPQALAAGGERLRAAARNLVNTPAGQSFAHSQVIEQIETAQLELFWGTAQILYDDPNKIATLSNNEEDRLLPKIRSVFESAQNQMLVVSPYFIPGEEGVEFIESLCKRGVRVQILTNSMESTDVPPVYAAYSRYRKELLEAGAELYEFKPDSANRPNVQGPEGSDRASLHAKTFTFDRQRVFVGSFNLDPRSARLNTEVGVVFDCPEMAQALWHGIDQRLMQSAWRVEGVPKKVFFWNDLQLNWVTEENGQTIRLTQEPGANFWRGVTNTLYLMLPIESQL